MAIVYQHRRNDTNKIFYVGIGKNKNRAYKKNNRNQHWHNIVNKYGYTIEILLENIEWDAAINQEINLIQKYGRIDLGTGILVNMTDGGEGKLGTIHTTDAKRKISEANKGKNHYMYGKSHTAETIQKMKDNHSHYWQDKKFNASHSAKISDSMKGDLNHFFGMHHTNETKEMLSIKNSGYIHTESAKVKISVANKGIPKTKEHKQKISAANKGKKNSMYGKTGKLHPLYGTTADRINCPHCNQSIDIRNVKRWHFDKCKYFRKDVNN